MTPTNKLPLKACPVADALKPCPFCGRSGPTIIGYWFDMAGLNKRVRCTCGVAVGGGIDEAADRERWNTRAAQEPTVKVDQEPTITDVKRVRQAILDAGFNTYAQARAAIAALRTGREG